MNQGLGSNGFPLRRFSGSMFNLPGCHQVQSQHLKHQDLKPRLHEIASCLAPFQASASIYVYPKCTAILVDGSEIRRSPVEVGSLSHYLQGFMHSRWCRISATNRASYSYISCLTSCRWSCDIYHCCETWNDASLWAKVNQWEVKLKLVIESHLVYCYV